MKIANTIKLIRDFFFEPQQVQSVAVIRIVFGVLLLLNWFMVINYLGIFYGPEGMFSLKSSFALEPYYRLNLFQLFPDDPRTPYLLATFNLVAVLGMLFGFFTRASTIFAFLTLTAFQFRNGYILNSSDIVIRNLMFFLIFTPCGEAYSVDRLIRTWRGKAPCVPVLRAPWALRLMQIQFAFIYIATVMYKIQGVTWVEGTAIYYATRLDEFVRFPLPLLNSFLLTKLMTWGTLLVEFALGTLIWFKELRYWVLFAGVGLHLGIEFTMSIPMFEWIMLAGMLCMIDSRDIYRLELWVKAKFRSALRLEGILTAPTVTK